MIRLLLIAGLVVLAGYVLARICRGLKHADLDWTGIAFAVGFVVMAFWLRHVTGMG
jgi:hypothetical protein